MIVLVDLYLFCMLIGAAKAVSDAYMFERTADWQNKYAREPESGFLIKRPERGLYGWYHRTFGLSYRERFLFSATALVAFTDGFHAFDSLRRWLSFFTVLYALAWPPLDQPLAVYFAVAPLFWLAHSSGFHAVYQRTRKYLRK